MDEEKKELSITSNLDFRSLLKLYEGRFICIFLEAEPTTEYFFEVQECCVDFVALRRTERKEGVYAPVGRPSFIQYKAIQSFHELSSAGLRL